MTDPGPTAPAEGPAPTASTPRAPTPAPPWEREGTPFDAARAWTLLTNLRADLDAARARTPTSELAAPPAPTDHAGYSGALREFESGKVGNGNAVGADAGHTVSVGVVDVGAGLGGLRCGDGV